MYFFLSLSLFLIIFVFSEGIDLGLIGEVEKYSDLVGQNAIFSKVQRIARLPPLLCIQYMRFFWKETPESRDHAGVKCKIVKSVQFDLFFDPLQHCSESLKQRLLENRQKREQVRDRMRDMRMDDEQEGSDSTTFDNEVLCSYCFVSFSSFSIFLFLSGGA